MSVMLSKMTAQSRDSIAPNTAIEKAAGKRACILSKLRGNGTATLEMMKNVAKSFCNSDVEIIEYNDEFRFEIKFDGTASAIENKDGFLKAIRELKPAHLQETLIEMTSLPSTLYVGTAIGSYKQEVICNVNI